MSDESRTGRRFEVCLPIKVKGTSEGQSFEGVTDNVSAAGVYIRGDASFPVGSKVRFSMTLPGDSIGARQDIEIECQGRVMRVEETHGKGTDRTGVACLIDEYKFVAPPSPPPTRRRRSGGSNC